MKLLAFHPKPPIGGGHWIARHGQNFKGQSPREVIDALTAYRQNNALPLGDPEREVTEFYAARSPWWVEASESGAPINNIRQRVSENVVGIWYAKFERLSPIDPRIEERLACCADCPMRVPRFTEPATDYSNEADRRATLMTGDLNLSPAHCAHHHWLIALAVRLAEPEKLALPDAPASCFVAA